MHRVAEIEGDQRILGEAILVDGHRGLRVTMACPNCVSEPVRVEPGNEFQIGDEPPMDAGKMTVEEIYDGTSA